MAGLEKGIFKFFVADGVVVDFKCSQQLLLIICLTNHGDQLWLIEILERVGLLKDDY
jgi:hypothetical protein